MNHNPQGRTLPPSDPRLGAIGSVIRCHLTGCVVVAEDRNDESGFVHTKVLTWHTKVCDSRCVEKKIPPQKPIGATQSPLERTSAQLPQQTIQLLDSWPGLNRSEALRLTLERYYYLEQLSAARAENLVEKYRPAFHLALEELSFGDYKVAVRSLPAIVMGAMGEESVRDEVERQRRSIDVPEIDWTQFKAEVASLDPIARIRVLDYVTGQRLTEDQ